MRNEDSPVDGGRDIESPVSPMALAPLKKPKVKGGFDATLVRVAADGANPAKPEFQQKKHPLATQKKSSVTRPNDAGATPPKLRSNQGAKEASKSNRRRSASKGSKTPQNRDEQAQAQGEEDANDPGMRAQAKRHHLEIIANGSPSRLSGGSQPERPPRSRVSVGGDFAAATAFRSEKPTATPVRPAVASTRSELSKRTVLVSHHVTAKSTADNPHSATPQQ